MNASQASTARFITVPPEGGTLYGIGVGPGDLQYLTVRAMELVSSVDVIGYFARRGGAGNARRIVEPLLERGPEELRLEYPVTTEIATSDPEYARQIGAFYEAAAGQLAEQLRRGRSVGLLAEGDPFFYGSFMHMWRRLKDAHPVEIVPGVTGMSGCWTRAEAPITWGDDVLTVLPGTLEQSAMEAALAHTDAAVIMKVGRHLAKVRRALVSVGLLERAIYVERGTMEAERVVPLAEFAGDDSRAPYFSLVLVPGDGRRI